MSGSDGQVCVCQRPTAPDSPPAADQLEIDSPQPCFKACAAVYLLSLRTSKQKGASYYHSSVQDFVRKFFSYLAAPLLP